MANYITTHSGRQFRLDTPLQGVVDLDDIAHHLSMICHWNGACEEFFSVAQHSILVSLVCPHPLQRWGLMHDAAEAYVGDVTRPLKAMLPDYKIIEKRVLRAIAQKFGLKWPEPPELKRYDNQIITLECSLFMHDSTILHDGNGVPVDTPGPDVIIPKWAIEPMEPNEAKQAFLRRYRKVFLDDDGL